ncbi:MAG TPA: type VI secretion system baseplate subunit TssK [Bryobacteraceae bacterium]|jgi:hypothetical protein|nr:type VI secretion system baseplate subunit TssK [Bryobacteraceae bacterium]
MNPEDVRLSSVNWEHGMLLTPEHFLRQERYFEAGLLWALRYATNGFGLVGGGARLPESERGAVRHDPVVVIDEDESALRVTVTQCRALTPSGSIVDIDPEHPVHRSFDKAQIEGVSESGVYVVANPQEKQVLDGAPDEFNPQMKTERRPAYFIALQPQAGESSYAVAVARVRRQRYGAGFEKDSSFIPQCLTMSSYSELASAWRKINENMALLAGRYTELHRATRDFLSLFRERGIETEVDAEVVAFVDRIVIALQDCVYDLLDPVQAPIRFFGTLRRFFHSAATYLDLSPAVQQYFDTLRDTGETEFIALIDQQRRLLKTTRTWAIHDDLAVDVRESLASIYALQRLERALEGKYLDFRISPSLEAMNFLFDRGGRVLYKIAGKPARAQAVDDDLRLYFTQLRLEGREKYRLILVGEQNARFEKGLKITIEIRLNEGSGFRRAPIILSREVTDSEQCNFDYDFDAPEVPTITDIQVSVPGHLPIRSALLFVRYRFYAPRSDAERSVEPLQPLEPRTRSYEAGSGSPQRPSPTEPAYRAPEPEPDRYRREPERPARYDDRQAPWETPSRRDDRNPEPPAPPRRRRLE